jgi:hypothetical protein
LYVALVIYHESQHDARSTKCKKHDSSVLDIRYFKMRNDGCTVHKNKKWEQLMSVRTVFTVVRCGAEGGKEGRRDVGHVLA